MRKLLRANFARLWKDKVFWGALVVLACYGVLGCISQYRLVEEGHDPEQVGDRCVPDADLSFKLCNLYLCGTPDADCLFSGGQRCGDSHVWDWDAISGVYGHILRHRNSSDLFGNRYLYDDIHAVSE